MVCLSICNIPNTKIVNITIINIATNPTNPKEIMHNNKKSFKNPNTKLTGGKKDKNLQLLI